MKNTYKLDFKFRNEEFTIEVEFSQVSTAGFIRSNILEKFAKDTEAETFKEFFIQLAEYYGLDYKFAE